MRPTRHLGFVGLLVAALLALAGAGDEASAQQPRNFRFAYDQPKTTGYGIVGDVFSDKLKELSKGTMLIDQYPGAQLGQEPQVLQLRQGRRYRFLHLRLGKCVDALAAGRRDVAALPVPLRGPSRARRWPIPRSPRPSRR